MSIIVQKFAVSRKLRAAQPVAGCTQFNSILFPSALGFASDAEVDAETDNEEEGYSE